METQNKNKVWSLRYTPGNSDADKMITDIAKGLGISDVIARLIYNRGYRDLESAKVFLSSSSEFVHDPYLMMDMDRAVSRIHRAISDNEKITIYGDYDVDGVTAVTVLYLYIKSLGAEVDYYIPLRGKEGYGLSNAALDRIKEKKTSLIITVDTGITANQEVEYARSLGIDMVVTDHHECHGELPQACAVVNPHRPDCGYPFKELAGVGVVFKLVCAYEMLRSELSVAQGFDKICAEYSDLVAMGTVADVMPLIDENRIIVQRGLALIDNSSRCGLSALIEAASMPSAIKIGQERAPIKKRKINSGFISFTLAPRINAAGRISSAEKAVELFLANDYYKASSMAMELCQINSQRQIEENNIADRAYKMIEESCDLKNDRVIVLSNDYWQQGIIGIVSSRITEKYGLPSILISFDGATRGYSSPDDIGKGSGRSVKGINLVAALDYCKDLIVQFGGHELAAGLSVMRCNIDDFRQRINEYVKNNFSDDIFCKEIEADCELKVGELSIELANDLLTLEPFGVANATPLFIIRNMTFEKVVSMGDGRHSKMFLSYEGKSFQAVCFGMSASTINFYPGERIDILCQLSVNEFRGQTNLQLMVQDLKISRELESEYSYEINRCREIIEGSIIDASENVIPTREDVAEVYKFLKYENLCGNNLFNFRSLRTLIGKQFNNGMNGIKLRLIVRILDEIKVCRLEDYGGDYFALEIDQNAPKTNLALSDTYNRIVGQCNVMQ